MTVKTKPVEDPFEAAERMALERPEPAAEIPPGIPDDELTRIQKWRASNHGALIVRNASPDEIELSIIGVIGGSWFGDGISARSVRDFLNQNKSAKSIRVLIDSPGGDYFDGVAIMNQLKRHAASVTTEVIGEASSAASVIAMGGDEIEMHDGTVMMVHRAWTIALGNGDQIRVAASLLDKIDDGLSTLYAARTGKTREDIDAIVGATTFMSAKEAVEDGFADRVVPAKQKQKTPKSAGAGRAAAMRVQLARNGSNEENPGGDREEQEETMATAVAILAILGLNEKADDASAIAEIQKLQGRAALCSRFEQLTGADTGDAALGTLKAWKASHDKLPAIEAAVAETRAASNRAELDTLVQKGRDEKKLTKAEADKLHARVEGYWKAKAEGKEPTDEQWSLSMARSYVAALSPQAHLSGEGGADPARPKVSGGAGLTWNGKPYEELSNKERVALNDEDEELFNKLRRDWEKRGQPDAAQTQQGAN